MVHPMAAALPVLALHLVGSRYSEQHTNATFVLDTPWLNQTSATVRVPKGYTVFPDIGVAYKYFSKDLTWDLARKHCIAEGGRLAVIDTKRKFDYANQMWPNTTHGPFVGLHSLFNPASTEWVSLKSGLPVTSIPWRKCADVNNTGTKCGSLHPDRTGVNPSVCNERGSHMCEVSLTADEPLPKNIMELPSGYTIFPDLGVAYKFYHERIIPWNSARKYCIVEGGNLAVIDSWEKVRYVNDLKLLRFVSPHVGIHKLFNNSEWVDFRHGLSPASLPWKSNPENDKESMQCTALMGDLGLFAVECTNWGTFVCEISISKDDGTI